ncbi:MAG TPA: HI0074 family nucleotidyltransferase substrate-binding subunit [Alphaproteobacteria bacterium]|nr:HI0074 family nucleotidyltransferase substrate-binding subunit [Alphaproteobacteria bacterium]
MKIKDHDFYDKLGNLPFVEGICLDAKYDVTSPRSVFEKAFELKLIDDEALWLIMLEDRNQTTHTYKRKSASEIYYRIKSYYPSMQAAYAVIQEKYKI